MKKILWLFGFIILLSLPSAYATTLYWSGDGVTQGGVGTWNTSTARWSTNASGGPFTNLWVNANVDSAVFDTAAGVVTIGTAIFVNTITTSLSGYSFTTGNKITFSGTDAGVNANHASGTTTISSTFGSSLFTKTGAGRLELNNSANATLKYILKAGFLTFASDNRLGTAPVSLTQDYMTFDGGGIGVAVATFDMGTTRGITIGAGGAFFGAAGAADVIIVGAPIVGTNGGALRITTGAPFYSPYNAACTLLLMNPNNSYNGATTISTSGTLKLGASGVLPDTTTLTLNGGSLDVLTNSDTIAKLVVTSSSSAISGSGTLTATNNYDMRASGAIAAVLAGNVNLVKTTTGNITLNGVKTYTGNTTNGDGTITINGTGTFGSSASILNLTGGGVILSANRAQAATLLHPINMTADTTIQNGSTGTGAILFRCGSAWTASAGTLTIKNITSTGAGSFDLILTNAQTFTQPIVIGASGDTLPCQLSSFNVSGTDQTFSAEISGYGTFRRSVSSGTGGRSIFTADNTYSGGTTLNSGTVLVNNPGPGSGTGTGPVTVGSSGTLGGTGIVAGVVMVNSTGSISPGSSTGILTLQGGLTMSGGGTNVWELASLTDDSNGVAGTDFDQIALTGGELDLSGNSRLLLKFIGSASAPYSTNTFWQANHSWTIIALTGTAANTTNLPFASLPNGIYNAGTFSNYVATGKIILTYTANAPSAPVITSQPQNKSVNVAASATFTVTAIGTDPEAYQWYFNSLGSPISSATNSSYTKANAQPADAGNYFVVVTNALGSATSSNAALTVILPRPTIQPLVLNGTTNVTISWAAIVGGSYQLQYNTNLATTDWYALSNLVAGSTNASVADFPPATDPQRYYRVLAQ